MGGISMMRLFFLCSVLFTGVGCAQTRTTNVEPVSFPSKGYSQLDGRTMQLQVVDARPADQGGTLSNLWGYKSGDDALAKAFERAMSELIAKL